jgi:predicted dehydrogenase
MKPSSRPALLNRRQFLNTTAVAAIGATIVPRHVLGGARFVPPSEKVNIAIVGVGGQGRTNVNSLFNEKDAQIIAIADPSDRHDLEKFYYKGQAGRLPVKATIEKHYSATNPGYKCRDYVDFREMFAKEKSIDAVLCATPDHLHAYVCLMAMKSGKHVYCEKPLTHNISEARLMASVAKETGVATQMGNQGHSGEGIRATCEWIWDGAIGTVREVQAWSGAGRWGEELPGGRPPAQPVPAGVNWDLWLGPREERPYNSAYTPVTWRDWWAFGSAPLGDMACHNIDPAVWALDLFEPLTVEASAVGGVDAEVTPRGAVYTYKFGPRGDKPPCTLKWFDGGIVPPRPPELEDDDQLGANGNGVLFLGDKGVIMCAGWGGAPRILPEAKMDAYKRPAKTIARVPNHHRDWLDACKGGKPSSANFSYGARLTEVVLLGLVALRCGKKIHWDASTMTVKNAPEAAKFLKGSYRKGWELA